jgi:phenylalanyl-tRNA synthetase beta chain
MKISLNWLRDFLDIDNTPSEIADILTSLGLEVEGWEEVKPSPVDLDRVVTGHVLSCEPIPDTDHLSATRVELIDPKNPDQVFVSSIVCGAPNVAAGQKVFVALPGAQVFSKDGSLFTIGERKVRGVLSQGMICAQDEMGVGSDHSGIMVLPEDTVIGKTAASWFKQDADIVFEIGLTPNRADATHHSGVARDLLAWIKQHKNPEAQLCMPSVAAFPEAHSASPIAVRVENSLSCIRYTSVSIQGVRVEESPEWLKNRLLSVGLRPINNIVDITNYIRVELGQPLHAFDQDKIVGREVIVKNLPEGTLFKALDETERVLLASDLMICDGQSAPMCMGGVFGGFDSGVKEQTVNIFLESACFQPRTIRRSMLKHQLRTDAAWSFEKGVDPNGTLYALKRAALMIQEIAGGSIIGGVTDIYPNPVNPVRIEANFDRIRGLIGAQISTATLVHILAALDIRVLEVSGEQFIAEVPSTKPDVTREADLVEEILRIYGLDNIPLPVSIRSSMEITPNPDVNAIKNRVADLLADQGYLECMGLSLSNSEYYQGPTAFLPMEEGSVVRVNNTANQGLDCLRPTLVLNGLESIRHNQNRQRPDLRLFEFGKTYRRSVVVGSTEDNRSTEGFSEETRLGIFLTGGHTAASWHPVAKKEVDFYTLKATVHQVLSRLGVTGYQETVVQGTAPYRYAVRYHRGPQELVVFGALETGLLKQFEVKNAVYVADFNFDNLVAAHASVRVQYSEISRYPTVRRDLALILGEQVTFAEVRQLAFKTAKKLLKEVHLFDVYEDASRLGVGNKSYAVSFTFEDTTKTLQDKEIDGLMGQLQDTFTSKLKAQIRK